MALPKLMRDIFANDGAGPLFRKDRIPAIGEADVPSIFVKVAKQTFTDAQKKQARTNIGADAIPPGTMMAYGGKSVPDGWLLCNGALVSRTIYAKLFAAIGTAWGAGDGSTTFKLPDADGRVMQGVTDASKIGKYIAAGLPNITGIANGLVNAKDAGSQAAITSFYTGCFSASEFTSQLSSNLHVGDNDHQVVLKMNANNGGSLFGSATTVQPPAAQVLMIIKA